MDRRSFVTTLAGVLLPMVSGRYETGRTGTAAAGWSALQKVMDDYVVTRRLAGAAAAIALGDSNPVFLRAGRIALDTEVPFDEHSLCRVYSMTKVVTGLAAMLLVEDGRLRLDQAVAEIAPELRALDVAIDPSTGLEARPATRTMTIRHLLTHTSGLAYWTPQSGTDALSTAYRARGITPGNYGPGRSRPGHGPQAVGLDEMLKRIAELPLASEPGTVWRYSVALDVMGLIIQRVSGKPLDVFARERLFEPLQMTATGFEVPPSAAPRLTTNYTVMPSGLAPLDPGPTSVFLRPSTLIAGGAGLVSSARDFARIGAMLIGDGTVGRTRVMAARSARLARSNLLPDGVSYDGGGYGAGMRVATGGSKPQDAPGAVSWNGAAGTMWLVDCKKKLNFVFMSQFMPPTAYPIWDEVPAALAADA